jgi:hypothetical protein
MKNILFCVSSHDNDSHFIVSSDTLTEQLQSIYDEAIKNDGVFYMEGYPECVNNKDGLTLVSLPATIDVVIHIHCYM